MEKISMKREWLKDVPILRWKGVPLIRIEKGAFVTAEPIGKNMRTLEIAERMAKQFAERYDCQATVVDDEEWKKVVNYLKVNFATKSFIQLNELENSEVLLLDSTMGKSRHVLAGGQHHGIDEIFRGFISDYDADGVAQPVKVAFFTIRLDPNLIE